MALITRQGCKISEAARCLDIGASLIGRWRRQFEDDASGVRLSGEEREGQAEVQIQSDNRQQTQAAGHKECLEPGFFAGGSQLGLGCRHHVSPDPARLDLPGGDH